MTNDTKGLNMSDNKKGYWWVPSLYLGEALPFSAVMLISVIMFKEFGLSDQEITLYTGWLGLPWVIKPLWSPLIDNLKTCLLRFGCKVRWHYLCLLPLQVPHTTYRPMDSTS